MTSCSMFMSGSTDYETVVNEITIYKMSANVKIENKRTLPSLTGFIYICEYFGITPQDFFNKNANSPLKSKEITAEFEKLSP